MNQKTKVCENLKTYKELKRFLIAGFSAVATDISAYYALIHFLPEALAKAISFILGTIVAFIINKYWTFEQYKKSYKEIMRFFILYFTTLGVNVLANKIVLDFTKMLLLAFLIATGISTILNFLGQKFWVFKSAK